MRGNPRSDENRRVASADFSGTQCSSRSLRGRRKAADRSRTIALDCLDLLCWR